MVVFIPMAVVIQCVLHSRSIFRSQGGPRRHSYGSCYSHTSFHSHGSRRSLAVVTLIVVFILIVVVFILMVVFIPIVVVILTPKKLSIT
jgi:preprotein translocase subunit SecG